MGAIGAYRGNADNQADCRNNSERLSHQIAPLA